MWERLERYELKRRERGMRGREPGRRPALSLPAGTDLLPQISHTVVLMMENHSYDNYLGMLRGRGEGFPLAADGEPALHRNCPRQPSSTHAPLLEQSGRVWTR